MKFLLQALVKLIWLFFLPGILAGLVYLKYVQSNYETKGYAITLFVATIGFWWIVVEILRFLI